MKKFDLILIYAALIALAACYWVAVTKIVNAPIRNYVAGDIDYPQFKPAVRLGE